MISEQTLNGNADFQNICDFTIPTPSQSYPDDLELTEETFTMVCKDLMHTFRITKDGVKTVEEKTRGQSCNSE